MFSQVSVCHSRGGAGFSGAMSFLGGEYPWNHVPSRGCMTGLSIQGWVFGLSTHGEYSGGGYSPHGTYQGQTLRGVGTHPHTDI